MHAILRIKAVLLALIAAALLAAPGWAQARVYWSVGIGLPVYSVYGYGPFWGDWDADYPWYPFDDGWFAWSPPVVVERRPVVVQSLPPGPAPQSFWYVCQNPAGYYPYVTTCPGGWTPVPAAPPAPPPAPSK